MSKKSKRTTTIIFDDVFKQAREDIYSTNTMAAELLKKQQRFNEMENFVYDSKQRMLVMDTDKQSMQLFRFTFAVTEKKGDQMFVVEVPAYDRHVAEKEAIRRITIEGFAVKEIPPYCCMNMGQFDRWHEEEES